MKLVKKYYPSRATNPCLLDDNKVDELCRKSYWIFKSKWRWRKLVEISGSNIETLEKQFDVIIEQHDKKLQEKRKMESENVATNGTEERSTEAKP